MNTTKYQHIHNCLRLPYLAEGKFKAFHEKLILGLNNQK